MVDEESVTRISEISRVEDSETDAGLAVLELSGCAGQQKTKKQKKNPDKIDEFSAVRSAHTIHYN